MTDKVNIASIVSSQFPGFVREDHEAFVAFVKAYYEFLQQDYSTDLKTLRDIDTTLDEYIKHFKSEYASNIPFVLANERFVLPNIKDLNLAKGSEASYRLLFRLLFDKEITISYPGQQMLRASDGRWEQRVSIFVKIVLGTAEEVLDKTIEIITSTGSIFTAIHKQVDVGITIDGYPVYEFFIDRKWFGNISIDDRVVYDGTFISHIVPTITKLKITQGGKHFKIGELYEVGTTGTILKIVKTDNEGAIINAEIIQYSMDRLYEEGFVYNLVSKTDMERNLSVSDFIVTVPSLNHKHISFTDSTNGTSESFLMNQYDYNIDPIEPTDFFTHNYVGELLRQTSSSNTIESIELALLATIEFKLGPVSKYPGYYTANNGFLDDAMYIQDSRFYQTFSYVIQLDERLDTYKAAVKTLIHPSGIAMFGEYTITNDIDLFIGLESMLRVNLLRLFESVLVPDNEHFHLDKAPIIEPPIYITHPKPFIDFDVKLLNSAHHLFDGTTVDNESFSVTAEKDHFAIGKALSDAPVVTDAKDHFAIDKVLFDTPVVTDATFLYIGRQVSDTLDPVSDTTALYIGKQVSDTLDPVSDVNFLNIGKALSDTLDPITDAKDHFDIDKVLSDTPIVTDAKDQFAIDKALSDTPIVTDAKDQFAIDKALSDTLDPVSDTTALYIGKQVSDTLDPVSDANFLNIGKALSDAPVVTDAKDHFVIGKALSDAPVVTDAKDHFVIGKVLFDTSSITDLINILRFKVLYDTASIADAKDHFVIGKALSDAPVVTDAKDHFVIGKVLSDVIYISSFINVNSREFAADSLNTMSDVQNYNINKVLLDAPTISDVQIFNINKPFADTLDPVSDVSSINTGKAFSNAIFLSDTTNIFLNGSALSYKYDTQTVLDSGGQIWKNAYLEDMTTFANDGVDYMENKIVF
jgi:hypothetical protein